MKRKIDFNNFKKLGIEFDLDKTYKIDFIPSPIEDEIWQQMNDLNAVFSDMRKVTPEWNEKIKYWIWECVNHDRNDNGDIEKEKFFYLMGAAERLTMLILIVELLGNRMKMMQDILSTDEKKTLEIQPTDIPCTK
jgi:hypothetical protein